MLGWRRDNLALFGLSEIYLNQTPRSLAYSGIRPWRIELAAIQHPTLRIRN